MISPELIRRYKFFSGLNSEQITSLSKTGDEHLFDEGHYFFHEEEELENFYLIVEGNISINLEIPEQDKNQPVSKQLLGELKTREITLSTLGPGDVFGISAFIPPHNSTSCAKSVTSCKVIVFDVSELKHLFEINYQFGYLMTQKAAQIIRDRLRNMYIESITYLAD
jgi:CRP-like cAMP-binding protein